MVSAANRNGIRGGIVMPDHINHPAIETGDAPFSVIVRDDRYVFLSGIVATDMNGGAKVVGDIAAETRLVMTTIRQLLASVDLAMEDIVRVEVHLTDLDDMKAMNAVYHEFFAERQEPARTTTQSGKLAGGSNVEITCMARLRQTS
jgi:2-iminobutanoate/2-iminopropanoate deaminase